jgi:hypothetical protein
LSHVEAAESYAEGGEMKAENSEQKSNEEETEKKKKKTKHKKIARAYQFMNRPAAKGKKKKETKNTVPQEIDRLSTH